MHIIASSSDDSVGVGTLLSFTNAVEVVHNNDGWLVTDSDDEVFECYDVVAVENKSIRALWPHEFKELADKEFWIDD